MITETYPPEVNGVALTIHQLVVGLAERGHEVEVIRPKQSRADWPKIEGRIEQVTVPGMPLPRYSGLHFGLPVRGKLINRWKRQRPDVTHFATEGPLGLTAMWAAEKLNIPVTSSFHTNFHQYGKHYGFGFAHGLVLRYMRYVHGHATCTLVPSKTIQKSLNDSGFDNVLILARGVDTRLFDPAKRSEELRRQWGAGPDDLVACYVGRVAQEKNIPVTIKAFERMRQLDPKIKLVIVGDGPARAALEKQYPNYIYAGMRLGEDLATHYASCDLFIFASITETFGNVVIEALASGLPVLGYDYAAPHEFIRTGENGVIVPYDDEQSFLKGAEQLLAMRDRLPQMKQAARACMESHSWDNIIAGYEALLQDVADNGKVTVTPQCNNIAKLVREAAQPGAETACESPTDRS